jgi:excisionase family DNA binding protein
MEPTTTESPQQSSAVQSPWLTVDEAKDYMKVSAKQVYREIAAGRLRAARVGGRRQIRLRVQWLDAYLESCAIA